jgi:hypothetical protein
MRLLLVAVAGALALRGADDYDAANEAWTWVV